MPETIAGLPVRPTVEENAVPLISHPNHAIEPAQKTIAAPRPENPFQQDQFAGRFEKSAPQKDSQKTKWVLTAGGLVMLIILFAGVFWFVKHNKAATPVRTRSASTTEPVTGKSAPPRANGASFTETIKGSEMQMVAVKGGTFQMGSPASEAGRDQDEGPESQVTVQDFFIGKYEVTQSQYQAVTGVNPSKFKGDNLPVDSVSWSEAVEFCRKLSQLSNRQYRLPTEAEWEYAARAGTEGPYPGDVNQMAWYGSNSGGTTHAVGQKTGNRLGLFDMNGNLWEWCQSKYRPYPYSSTDGRENLDETDVRVLRGGSWESSARGCRSAYRRRVTPHPQESGFRIVMVNP